MQISISICPLIGFGYNHIRNRTIIDGENHDYVLHQIVIPLLSIMIGGNNNITINR